MCKVAMDGDVDRESAFIATEVKGRAGSGCLAGRKILGGRAGGVDFSARERQTSEGIAAAHVEMLDPSPGKEERKMSKWNYSWC